MCEPVLCCIPHSVYHVVVRLFEEDRQRAFYSDEDCYRYGNAALAYVFLMIFSFTLPDKDVLSTMSAAEIGAIRVTHGL